MKTLHESTQADRRKRRGEALKIIFNSVGGTRQEEIRALIKQHDIQGMWERIKKFNKANEKVYISRLCREFFNITFDPAKIRVSEFLNVLNRFKISLASTPQALTNEDIREQLYLALRATLHSRTRKPGVCKTKGVLKNVLYYFKSTKQLSHSRPHSHNRRGRTNLRGEGKTEVVREVVGIEAALVDSTVPLHVTARRLE
jgi:hypothetical protein